MKIIKGDLLNLADEGHFDVIVHGCNCFNTMGSGIAHQIATRYPQAYKADLETTSGDISKLGTYTHSYAPSMGSFKKFMIVNAYTQYGFNRGVERPDIFEYEAFEKILKTLATETKSTDRIGFPLIGCERAGGDRGRIMALIEENLPNATVVEWKMIND